VALSKPLRPLVSVSLCHGRLDQLDELASFAALQGEAGGLLNQEDVVYAAAGLEPNSSAALIVWEDTWAAELSQAVRNANGVVLDGARIRHDLAEQALTELAAAGGTPTP
jgi:hypothetical protein